MKRSILPIILVLGCSKPHVTLRPPMPDLPPDGRIAIFQSLAATYETTEFTHSCSGQMCSSSVTKSLTLANGTLVYHAEDLLPVLPPDSESAHHIAYAANARARHARWGLITGSIVLGGFGGGAIALGTDHPGPGIALMGIGTVGLIVAFVGLFKYQRAWERETDLAFATYTKGLAETLAVCTDGLRLYACDAAGPADARQRKSAP